MAVYDEYDRSVHILKDGPSSLVLTGSSRILCAFAVQPSSRVT